MEENEESTVHHEAEIVTPPSNGTSEIQPEVEAPTPPLLGQLHKDTSDNKVEIAPVVATRTTHTFA